MTGCIPAFQENGWLPPGHYQASWDEITQLLRNGDGSRRAKLTDKLICLKNELIELGVSGTILLNGSYVSSKAEPADFDILLMAPPDIQAIKEMYPRLKQLLDAEYCEKELGFSFLYFPSDSTYLDNLRKIWDIARDGTQKGVIEVIL